MFENNHSNDPENMAAYIQALPQDLAKAWQLGLQLELPEMPKIERIIICGMGGSAIGGDFLASYLSDFAPIPVFSHRGYGLPAWANGPETLVICSSHSGNTEETLDAFQAAQRQNCSLLGISTGGKLERLAKDANRPHWSFQHSGQPRTAIAWSFGLLLALVERLGLIGNQQAAVEKAIRELENQQKMLEPASPTSQNPAKRLAGQLLGRNVVIFAAGNFEVIARRWKTQINELAKAWASFEALPEMNHNTLAGLVFPDSLFEKTSAIFLRSASDHPRNQLRIDLSMQFFLQAGIGIDAVTARGDDKLSQMWSLLQFGDYVSYYLALAYGIDPTPVEALNFLKDQLAQN